MIKYPDKPWVDGQTFTHTTKEGDELAGIYDAPTNTWSFWKGNSDVVFTNTVYTVGIKPAEGAIARAGQVFNDALPLPDVENLTTQQDVNWYLYDLINSIDGGSQIWVGLDEPPGTDEDNPITKFWWKDDEEQLYVWDTIALEWKLTGLMDFDRPPIVGNIEPLEHPKFPGEPLEQGDLWYNTSRLELFIYWNGAWFPTSAPSVGFDGVSTETFTYTVNRIYSITDEIYLKNLEQDGRLDVIEENIGELEEEIEALAPSTERGEWLFNALGTANPGYYALLDENTAPTDLFSRAAHIYVSTRDADNGNHDFNNHAPGEYLQIFNRQGDGYGLYIIRDIDDRSGSPNPHFGFTVDFVRNLTTAPRAIDRGRFKFFTIAEGEPDMFVQRQGDDMFGDLRMTGDAQVRTRFINSGQNTNLSIQRNSDTKIIVGSENVQLQKPIKFVESSFATANEHAIHKGYVDEQIAELLAKIEELEMSGTNYRFEFRTRTPFRSGEPGDAMDPGQIFSQSKLYSDYNSWYVTTGNETEGLGGEFGWVYVCFGSDEWSINSTGSLHSVQKNLSNSTETFVRDSKVFNLAISNAEKCPDEYSNGKNIWRFEVVPILYKNRDYEGQYLSNYENDTDIYITFAGGSVSKVTS